MLFHTNVYKHVGTQLFEQDCRLENIHVAVYILDYLLVQVLAELLMGSHLVTAWSVATHI